MTVSERIDRLESKLGGIPDSRISRSYVESPPVNRTVILKIGWLLEIAVASEGDGHSTPYSVDRYHFKGMTIEEALDKAEEKILKGEK